MLGIWDLVSFEEAFLQWVDSLSWSFEDDKAMAVSTNSDVFSEIAAAGKHTAIMTDLRLA